MHAGWEHGRQWLFEGKVLEDVEDHMLPDLSYVRMGRHGTWHGGDESGCEPDFRRCYREEKKKKKKHAHTYYMEWRWEMVTHMWIIHHKNWQIMRNVYNWSWTNHLIYSMCILLYISLRVTSWKNKVRFNQTWWQKDSKFLVFGIFKSKNICINDLAF